MVHVSPKWQEDRLCHMVCPVCRSCCLSSNVRDRVALLGNVQERPLRFCFPMYLLVFCGLSYTECLLFCFLPRWSIKFMLGNGNHVAVWDFQVIYCLITKHRIDPLVDSFIILEIHFLVSLTDYMRNLIVRFWHHLYWLSIYLLIFSFLSTLPAILSLLYLYYFRYWVISTWKLD